MLSVSPWVWEMYLINWKREKRAGGMSGNFVPKRLDELGDGFSMFFLPCSNGLIIQLVSLNKALLNPYF